jgi:hypothetical protein
MILTINVSERKEKAFAKTASELVNAVCGHIDKEFEVAYIDHTIEADEKLIDDSEDRDI